MRRAYHAGAVDVRLDADPSDLDLWLWGRRSDDVLAVEGDRETVQRFRARLAVATE